jgi:hypothetical protein
MFKLKSNYSKIIGYQDLENDQLFVAYIIYFCIYI